MQYLLALVALLSLSTAGHSRSLTNEASISARKETFLDATVDLTSALRQVVHYTDLTDTDVLVEEILRGARKAQDIYFNQFTPAVRKYKSVLQADDTETITAEEYSSEIVQELRDAANSLPLTQDLMLALILGEGNIMQQDGVRLGLSLRLLQRLLQRVDEALETFEVSLSGVREVSAVADAAMEALQGVRRAAQHAQVDAEAVFKGEKPSGNAETTEQIDEDEEQEVSVEESSEDKSASVQGFASSENGIMDGGLEESKDKLIYKGKRVRRQSVNLKLGGGFRLGGGGLLTYSGSNWSISATPTFSSYLPPKVNGVKLTIRF